MKLVFGIIASLLVGLFVFLITDALSPLRSPIVNATVVDRVYSPSSTGFGFAGKTTVVTTTSEKWAVIVLSEGEVFSVGTSSDAWRQCEVGREIKVRYRKGWMTGFNWGWQIESL